MVGKEPPLALFNNQFVRATSKFFNRLLRTPSQDENEYAVSRGCLHLGAQSPLLRISGHGSPREK